MYVHVFIFRQCYIKVFTRRLIDQKQKKNILENNIIVINNQFNVPSLNSRINMTVVYVCKIGLFIAPHTSNWNSLYSQNIFCKFDNYCKTKSLFFSLETIIFSSHPILHLTSSPPLPFTLIITTKSFQTCFMSQPFDSKHLIVIIL